MTTNGAAETFGALLRRYRLTACLSQEALAERARLSVDAIAALERGRRTAPRPETVALLAEALQLSSSDRDALVAAVTRGRALPAHPTSILSSPPSPLPGSPALPMPLDSFIGREAEVAAIAALMRQPTTRLLTLTGPGGVGKTRLAMAVALEIYSEYGDGSIFVPLAALRDPDLVPSSIAQALGLREESGQRASEQLMAHLRDKHLLLMLDNFEQIVDAASLVTELLETCPRLDVLMTSRMTLHVRGEQAFRVPPLPVPGSNGATEEDIGDCASVRLFVERAQAALPSFDLSVTNAGYVAEICRRLDGLPLAIELAAARIVLLPPRALLARLSSRLKLLTRGAQNLPERQQTLRDAIAWSYDLLTPAEQRLFRRLAVFAGSWILEAAESICAAPAGAAPPGSGILDELESLMEKNLVRRQESARTQDVDDEEPRFGMLETIHEYALEQLDASDEAETLRKGHAMYYLTLTEEAEPELAAKEQRAWLERLEQEHDNLRAALGWARERHVAAIGLRMAGVLNQFWQIRGYLSEGLGWLASLLALPADPQDEGEDEAIAAVRSKALLSASGLASWMDDYPQAIALAEAGLALYRRIDEKQGIASALSALGGLASLQGDTARAMALDEECLRLQREVGNTRGLAIALGNLGTTMRALGDDARAEMLFSESLSLYRQLGDQMAIATRLYSLATVAQKLGDYARASTLYEESLDLRRQLGDRQHIADSLQGMADIALIQGDHERARALYVESLTESRNLGYKLVFVGNLEGLAAVASAEAQPARAARLFGAAEALRAAIGAPSYFPGGRAIYDQTLTTVRTALSEIDWASSLAAGHKLSLEQAIAEALDS